MPELLEPALLQVSLTVNCFICANSQRLTFDPSYIPAGLLAYAIATLDGKLGYRAWRYVFTIRSHTPWRLITTILTSVSLLSRRYIFFIEGQSLLRRDHCDWGV